MQTQICKFHVRDTVKQRQKGEKKWQEHIRQANTEIYSKSMGIRKKKFKKRVEDTFNTIFYGNDDERFYHEAGDDMGYMEDTGNHDVRTEGMSYGMMVCVQLDKKQSLTDCGNGCAHICT